MKFNKYEWFKNQDKEVGVKQLYQAGILPMSIYVYWKIYNDYLRLSKENIKKKEVIKHLSIIHGKSKRLIYYAIKYFEQ